MGPAPRQYDVPASASLRFDQQSEPEATPKVAISWSPQEPDPRCGRGTAKGSSATPTPRYCCRGIAMAGAEQAREPKQSCHVHEARAWQRAEAAVSSTCIAAPDASVRFWDAHKPRDRQPPRPPRVDDDYRFRKADKRVVGPVAAARLVHLRSLIGAVDALVLFIART